jgi:outer membrane protein
MAKNFMVAVAVLILSAIGVQAAEMKIGFVDVRKAVESTKQGKKVKTELETEFKKREKELQKKADDIKKMTTDFEKKNAVLAEDARLKKQQEIQEEMLKYNQDVQKNTADIRKKEQDLMEPIFKKMQKVIDDVAKKENYTLVLQSRDNILYAVKEVDLTDSVVKAFEKE